MEGDSWHRASSRVVLALVLAAAVLACYWGVRLNGFLVIDDDRYVTNNPFVKDGLTRDGVAWAMTATREANWHPLTWVSHMLDVEWHRFDASGHHATSVLLHAGNTVSLFFLVAALVGARWPGFLAAALFGVHPLHVEAVAWVAERKEVLSVLWFLAATGAYLRYARTRRLPWYGGALLAFLLGLASKPMVVTLPFALLLLDLWPLGRFLPVPGGRRGAWFGPLLEKLPFLALSAGSAAVTLVAQGKAGVIASWSLLPLSTRLANAAVSSVDYLTKTVLPAGLSAIYPLIPARLTAVRVGWCLSLIVLVTAAVLAAWWRRPALVVGWLWFLGTLVPVIGIVQVGVQGMADRYTYLPHVGLFMALACAGRGVVGSRRHRTITVLAAVAVLAALSLMTRLQVTRWRTTGTLLLHAVAVDPGNYQAWYLLGVERAGRGDNRGALAAYREALAIRPEHVESRYRMATTHLGMGDPQAAYREYLVLRTAAPPVAAELLRFIDATERWRRR